MNERLRKAGKGAGPRRGDRVRSFARWVGLCALALVSWVAMSTPSEARLQPYYVVDGKSFGQIRPRILFVLDTSGSMAFKAQAAAEQCVWSECENPEYAGTSRESRVAAARRAIRTVVEQTADQAKFAIMTFEQKQAPTSTPAKCQNYANGPNHRFAWNHAYGYFIWDWIWLYKDNQGSYAGAWRICQGNDKRPYPYLRWDNLGVGSVINANNQQGPVPPSPLISVNRNDMVTWANATRKVQWFPTFMGIRANLNVTTDPDKTILHKTVGDYGSTNTDRQTNVWGHDFYYWPYVDGFPGYAQFSTGEVINGFVYGFDGLDRAGIATEDPNVNAAALYGPFYLDLSDTNISSDKWGPASDEEALNEVLEATAPIMEGGVDAVGGTPWKSVIGTIPASPPQSNAPYSHTTVASYLKFVNSIESSDVCAPTVAILVTDGEPDPASEGGSGLYQRLAALRKQLNVKTYVVGFFLSGSTLNNMACAAAGACDGTCSTPCDDTPANGWDTCDDENNPATGCAYLASSADELQKVVTQIVAENLELDVFAGPGSTVNEFGVGAQDEPGKGERVQTKFTAYTEFPGWKGHLVRSLCTDRDTFDLDGDGDFDELAPHCVDQPFDPEDLEETFGPCPQSREWDAGECLQLTAWKDRRIYTYDENNNVFRITNPDGTATAQFRDELQELGLISGGSLQAKANAIAEFILGRNAPGGWKLPGLANSAPVVVRRIPPYRPDAIPEVAIRDPHCGGRAYGVTDAGALPESLRDFARESNDPSKQIQSPSPHWEYQEAVLVGDDMGVLHAFQLDSGNELWGLIPRPLLAAAAAQAANGPTNMGQPEEIANHIYGIASVVNHAWIADDGGTVADPADDTWYHFAIFGFGKGGKEYVALDLKHMSPASPQGPIDVLWTTEDPGLKAIYDPILGETWARPAVGYHVQGNALNNVPKAYVLLGSGYPLSEAEQKANQNAPAGRGRTLVLADAITGQLVEQALLPDISHPLYESMFGAVTDPAVGTHCKSRYWAEMQEAYVADPAGRLFRWDLAAETNHEADSGGPWNGLAKTVTGTYFPACQGAGDTCTVAANNRGDVFVYPPAVSASNRIDDNFSAFEDLGQGEDQFLVALISGSAFEDTIDPGAQGNDFHSSLYLLVDDYRGDKTQGFQIPAGAPKSFGGTLAEGASLNTGTPSYLRLALTDIERTRVFTPYEGAAEVTETRKFSRGTRPIRAPRIFVTGLVDGTNPNDPEVVEGVEVYYIEYTVYEPGSGLCDPTFYDAANQTWHYDKGASYVLRFRLTADAGDGFNLNQGSDQAGGYDLGGANASAGLVLEAVEQIAGDACPDGNCGATPGAASGMPCDNNQPGAGGGVPQGYAVPLRTSQISGFSPVE